jgi:hypothetical protein
LGNIAGSRLTTLTWLARSLSLSKVALRGEVAWRHCRRITLPSRW